MNRPLIITIGIVIILLVAGVWAYLLIFGSPKQAGEVFTNLGLLSPQGEATIVPADGTQNEQTQLAIGGERLEQLTTRPVAGFVATSTPQGDLILYVERGTGHVYEVNVTTQTETQRAITTFPQASEAVFSPLGTALAITTFSQEGAQTAVSFLATTSHQELSPKNLPVHAENIAFADEQTVRFTLEEEGETTGYAYDLEAGTRTTLFSIPFVDVMLRWNAPLEHIYAYTKPSKLLEGYAYELSGDALLPVPHTGYGLTALFNDEYQVVSTIEDEQFSTVALQDARRTPQALFMIPEKCTFTSSISSEIWCAAPLDNTGEDFLEDWYKGIVLSEDYLWVTNLSEGSSALAADLQELSGKIIDVLDIAATPDGRQLLFINKTDRSLWVYRMEEPQQ